MVVNRSFSPPAHDCCNYWQCDQFPRRVGQLLSGRRDRWNHRGGADTAVSLAFVFAPTHGLWQIVGVRIKRWRIAHDGIITGATAVHLYESRTADFTGSFHTLCAAVGLSGPEKLGTDG